MKTSLIRCMTMVAITFWVSSAAANSIDVDLEESSANLTIYYNDQSSGGPNQVLFSFTNGGPSSLAGIYIEDDNGLLSFDRLYESNGVDFTTDGGGPANLPGGKPLGFSADFAFRVEKNTADGIDGDGETLGIIFNLKSGVTLADIYDAIEDKKLKIEPDPRGPGDGGGSLGTNPVPEPASLVLFGIGTAGLAGFSRRRRNKK